MKAFQLYKGAGKLHAELRRHSKKIKNEPLKSQKDQQSGFVYVFARAKVESTDFCRFLTSFGPAAQRHHLQQGRVSFAVDGYDDVEEQLFEIEEVRSYFGALTLLWPCWAFAADLRNACFHSLVLSTLPNITIRREVSSDAVTVQVPEGDLQWFMSQNLPTAAMLHSYIGLSPKKGARRIRAVARYLGVPEPCA